jgi:hypothetical protein
MGIHFRQFESFSAALQYSGLDLQTKGDTNKYKRSYSVLCVAKKYS